LEQYQQQHQQQQHLFASQCFCATHNNGEQEMRNVCTNRLHSR